MALIILAHPDIEKSVVNRTIVDLLKKDVPDLTIRNIQSLYPDFKIDVTAEQQELLKHQTIVFQYPFYWYNMPAILKHWFDKVFEYQFAYGSKGDKLKGKNFVASFTVGAPRHQYRTLHEHHFRVLEFCKNIEQTAYYAQMNFLEPIYFHVSSSIADKESLQTRARVHAEKLKQLLYDVVTS